MNNVDINHVIDAVIAMTLIFFGHSLQYIGRLFGQLLVVHRQRAHDKLARSRQGVTQATGKQAALKPGTP